MILLHILAGTSRGGCESNAMCLIRESPYLRHWMMVLGAPGEMSPDFAAVTECIDHAAALDKKSRCIVRAIENFLLLSRADNVIIWHGMVALPEVLHALRNFPGCVLVHGGNPASHSLLVDAAFWMREKWFGSRAHPTYVCCSHHVADSFEGSVYLRRFAKTVVPNGVRSPGEEIHSPRPIEEGETFTIGMVARLDHIKDHPALLRAFALVVKSWPTARLELVGDGERREELEKLSQEIGISAQVRFAGSVPDPYLIMRGWDLFAYTTTIREGLGNALAEALMFGLPCVATDRGPIREVLGEGQAGILVPPDETEALADAIITLALNHQRRKELSEEGRRRAMERYSPSGFASGYLSLLRSDHHS